MNCCYEKPKRVDLGDGCVFCRESTAPGSGRFVNRIPTFGHDPNGDGIEYDGYICQECDEFVG